MQPLTATERLWRHVDKSGPIPQHAAHLGRCWLWTGTVNDSGYGLIRLADHSAVTAHRTAYLEHYGPPPADKPHVLHRCDTRRCIRWSHLRPGTNSDNIADRLAHGASTSNPGERNGRALLTAAQVEEIRTRYAQGDVSQSALGVEYGVNQRQISRVIRRHAWA